MPAPEQVATLQNIMQTYERGELTLAISMCKQWLQHDTNSLQGWLLYGLMLKDADELDQAASAIRQSLVLAPNNEHARILLAEIENTLGIDAYFTGDVEQALTLLQSACTHNPNFPLAHANLATVELAIGDFMDGWIHYEARWQTDAFKLTGKAAPFAEWRGETLTDQDHVLLWDEQGVGDTVLFASILHELEEIGCKVTIACEARMVPLLARSFPWLTATTRNDPSLRAAGITHHAPMGRLATEFRRSLDSFLSSPTPFLTADAALVETLRTKYKMDDRPLIGFSWFSSNSVKGQRKTAALKFWAPLLRKPNVRWINLQYGDHKEEIDYAQNELHSDIVCDHTIDPLENLDSFAAQVGAMDLILTTSNATANFAGALGKPVWVLVDTGPDFRWTASGSTTPWYPTATIFRQQRVNDWDSVVTQVSAHLCDWMAGRL